jgi:CcmD family protein
MEPLLLVGYTAIFVALVVYLWHLRSRVTSLERKLDDLDGEFDN